MEEYKLPVGKAPKKEILKDWKQKNKEMQDTSPQTRRKIFIGIIAFVLVAGTYLCFFKKPPEMAPNQNLNPMRQEVEDELKNHQVFTADVIRSASTPIEGINRHDSTQATSGDPYHNNMLVLKEAFQSGLHNRPEISIPPASILTAHLERNVAASTIQTPVVAIVDEDLENGEKVIVPSGTKLMGHTLGIQGNDRVLIQFNSLLLPDNSTVYSFSGVAVDEDETQGVVGEKSRGTIYKAGTSLASTMLGLGVDSALTDNQSVFGQVIRQTAQNTTQDLSSMMSESTNGAEQSVVVTLAKDTPVKVLVTDNNY